MPSVKLPKKSTNVDMTPFVDVAFLILTFFIMATKFKPPSPVEVTTPSSVSSEKYPENDAVMITIDKDNKVYFTVFSEGAPKVFDDIIGSINASKNVGVTQSETNNFKKMAMVGVPFAQLRGLLQIPVDQQKSYKQTGIPLDSTGGELAFWINASKRAFQAAGKKKLTYLIKGDNDSKYPTFKMVIDAMRRNEEFKYQLVTAPEEAPKGTEYYNKIKGTK
jgi:biopolymer transport protein ExbD